MSEPITILRAVAGSTAQGLAGPGSDVDHHGVYAWPSVRFFELAEPPMSIVTTDPDETQHELKKFLGLALKSNPTVLETLWAEEYVEMEDDWGQRLVDLRFRFLSARAVHGAYSGYAAAQFKKLQERGDSFSSATKGRTWKHAKHIFRLLDQGLKLYNEGVLSVRVENPDWYHEVLPTFSIEDIKAEFEKRIIVFDDPDLTTVLPEQPDFDAVNKFLVAYRLDH